MKEGLLEKIQRAGYWRVNFRPLVPLERPLSFRECFDVVRENAVSLRGWDYPHISHRNDEEGGTLRGENFHENWCDWWGFHEFWRMYRSGQFLSYNALREDAAEDQGRRNGSLRILSTIYSVTEFVEFAHRLQNAGPYRDGVVISISLRNTAGRYLDVEPNRMPFFELKYTGADDICLERSAESSYIRDNHQTIAIDFLLELFDFFGWNPSRERIAADQAKFYRRDFS